MIGPPSFGPIHYVPALAIKEAEIGALDGAEQAGASCTPLFFLAARAFEQPVIDAAGKPGRERRAPTPAEVQIEVTSAVDRLLKWCNELRIERGTHCPRFFVDVTAFDDYHSVDVLCDMMRGLANHPSAVPVFSLERPWQHATVAGHHGATGSGGALRLMNVPRASIQRIERALKRCGLTMEATDLIIDFGDVTTPRGFRLLRREATVQTLAAIEYGPWRSVTVLANAMPQKRHENADDPYDDWPLPRYDWLLWLAISRELRQLPSRIPAFGDYATRNVQNLGLMFNAPPALLIYTGRRSWWVSRRAVRRGTADIMWKEMAADCVAIPQFRSPAYSFFEDRVSRCARDEPLLGRYTTTEWISAMIAHHIIYVSRTLELI